MVYYGTRGHGRGARDNVAIQAVLQRETACDVIVRGPYLSALKHRRDNYVYIFMCIEMSLEIQHTQKKWQQLFL